MMEIPLALRGIVVITGKNMRLYYTKPPVLMFGLLFPLFMFFAFFVGRKLDLATYFPAFLAMMLFFTASSVGPLITPWEKRDKTYERLLSYPVTQDSIILGDVAAGAIFGIGISLVIWLATSLFIPVGVANPGLFAFAFVIGTLSCSALGVLIVSPGSDNPPNVMIFSNLIADGGPGPCSRLFFAADLPCRPVQCGHVRDIGIFTGYRLRRAHRYLCRVYPCCMVLPETEPDEGDVMEKICSGKIIEY
jgi:hypothetical protein